MHLTTLLGTVLLLWVSTSATTTEPSATLKLRHYGVLMDAGSSSTKLKVYRWFQDPKRQLLPVVSLMESVRFKPGLATFEDDPDGLRNYIIDILDKAKELVPQFDQPRTPAFLMATAGMRFLTAGDAEELMDETRAVFADESINPFLYKPEGVTILSGEEEGVYAWLAANYLVGYFDEYKPYNESMGIMEMGGGSTQIAFIPRGPIYSEEFQVVVANRLYQLYVQSYLQYGQEAIQVKIAYELSKENPGETELENPCLLKDDTKESTLEDGTVIKQTGTGDPDACLVILDKLVKPDTGMDCSPKPCAIGSTYQPSVEDIKFYATDAFTYAPKALDVLGEDDVLNIPKLRSAAKVYCQKSISEMGNETEYASTNCVMGLYTPTLMTISYGFPEDTDAITVTSNIGEQRIDWALGAMLVELTNHFTGDKTVANVRRRRAADDN